MTVVVCAVVGLCIGSFLNVVIERVPAHRSVVRPRSHCPACNTQLANRDNVPVLSWLLLRGRCRTCGASISVAYPAVEIGAAVLFGAAAAALGDVWVLPAFLVFFASLLAISVIDLRHFIVPNRVLYPTLFTAAALLVLAALVSGSTDRLAHAAIGGVGGFVFMATIHFVSPRGMGFGDVRLGGLIGMMLGWLGLSYVVLGLFLGFLTASVVGIVLIVTRLRSRKDAVPFGPFMAMGAVIATVWGQALLDAYARR